MQLTDIQVAVIEDLIDAKLSCHAFASFVASQENYRNEANAAKLMELYLQVEMLKKRLATV